MLNPSTNSCKILIPALDEVSGKEQWGQTQPFPQGIEIICSESYNYYFIVITKTSFHTRKRKHTKSLLHCLISRSQHLMCTNILRISLHKL